MQEPAPGLDWVTIWHMSGALMKMSIVYGVAAVCLGFVRAAHLGRRVLSLPFRKRISIRDGIGSLEELATAGLKGRLSDKPPTEHGGEKAGTTPADQNSRVLRRVDLVDTEFSYRWEMGVAKALATRRLAWLIFLLAFASVAWEGYNYLATIPLRTSQYGDIEGGPGGLLGVFAVALYVSAFLYAIASFFEGLLAKRRAKWNYLRARIRDEAAGSAGE